jgi:hypothetical protein
MSAWVRAEERKQKKIVETSLERSVANGQAILTRQTTTRERVNMKLNKKGEVVFAISLSISVIAALAGAMWLLDHINWVGDHYCFKSSLECYFGGE